MQTLHQKSVCEHFETEFQEMSVLSVLHWQSDRSSCPINLSGKGNGPIVHIHEFSTHDDPL